MLPSDSQPGQFALQKSDIERLRKVSDDSAFSKAYQIDPGFKRAFDYYSTPEITQQLDPYMQQNLKSKLLNRYYYGDWEIEKQDDMTATMAQQATPQPAQEPSFLGKVGNALGQAYSYAQAPIQTVIGAAEHGINAAYKGITGQDTSLVNDAPYKDITSNIRKTGDIAPIALGTAGSVVGPLGTAAGTFAGQGINQLTEAVIGENNMTPVEQVARPVMEGVIAGTVDYGIGKLAKGAKKALEFAGDYMPQRLVNSLIKPANNEFKFGKNPGQAIVNEKIVGSSADDLLQKVTAKADDIGKEIQRSIMSVSAKKPPQIDVTSSISKPIDETIKQLSALEKTNAPTIQALTNLKDDLIRSYGGTHTPQGAWEAKRQIQSLINWKSDAALSNDINQALWKSFSSIGDDLNKAVPGLEGLNLRYSELIAAKTSIARRVMNAQRANMFGLQAVGSGIAGTAAFAQTGDPKTALAAAGAGMLMTKAGGTTIAKTLGAQAVKGLSKAGISALSTAAALAPAERLVLLQALQSLMGGDTQPDSK